MNKKAPKRILIIGLTERMGGVETFIYNTTIFSDKTKYEYDYLVHGANICVFQNMINKFYGEGHIFFVEKIKANPYKWFLDMKNFYKRNGCKYDYIHLQTGAASEVIYAFPFCLIYGIKVIAHSHNGNGYSPIINAIFRPLLNAVTHKRLACSEVAAKWLFGNKRKNFQIINNGIDINRFTFNENNREIIRKKYGITNELVIGHIGRFSEQKNHKRIIEIFRDLLYRDNSSKLILVGVGEKQEEIKELVRLYDMKKNVIFAGLQDEIELYYSAFDVFLMPSLYEGLPIVGIEAQSMGLRCLFSDQIDKQIIITDRAKMIPLTESNSKWIDEILNESVSINRLSYARLIHESGYSIQCTVEKLEKVYDV